MLCNNQDDDDIFTKKVDIFVAPDSLRKRQITIVKHYIASAGVNGVNGKQSRLLILPVPCALSVRFINLGNYSKLFENLEELFSNDLPTDSPEVLDDKEPSFSHHHHHHQLRTILCKNILDLKEICPIEFGIITDSVIFFLKKYYEYCGFIVCKINENQSYRPFAYSHEMSKGQLFVPTRHYTPIPNLLTYPGQTPQRNNTYQLCQWNHIIYSYNTHNKSGNCKMIWNKDPKYPEEELKFKFGKI
jgi:hypothetical protein